MAERLGGAVALVSGRSIAYLDALFAPLQLPTAGLHGVERRKASGAIQGASYVDAQLNAARTALASFVAAHPGTLLEDKDRSLAVHYRMAPAAEAAVRQAVAAVAKPMGTNYHIQEGNMVLEIKPYGFTKGTAVKEFMHEPPFSGRVPVFVGDDLTDEGGFRAVEAIRRHLDRGWRPDSRPLAGGEPVRGAPLARKHCSFDRFAPRLTGGAPPACTAA